MKKLLFAFLFVLSSCIAHPQIAQAIPKYHNWCMQGGQQVVTSGILSTTQVQQSYPTCTITVYNAGTLTLATLYSDINATQPLSNPFNNQSAPTGEYFFYTVNGHYDIQISAASLTPYTLSDTLLTDVIVPNPYSGSGTTNYLTKWTAPTAFGNSLLFDTGTNVVLGATAPDDATRDIFEVIANTTNTTRITVRNSNTGTTARASLQLYDGPAATTNSASVAISGPGFTPAGVFLPSQFQLSTGAGATNGITINATSGPLVLGTAGNDVLHITQDPFVQLTTSYSGATTSAPGTVAFRNHAGAIEASQNGGPWSPLFSLWSANGNNIYPSTTTNTVLVGSSTTDIASSPGALVEIGGYLGMLSAPANAAGLTIAYNPGLTAMTINTVKTGTALDVPLAIRVAGNTTATYKLTGLIDIGNPNTDVISGFATPLSSAFRTYARLSTSNNATDNFTSVSYVNQTAPTGFTAQAHIGWAFSTAPTGTVGFLVGSEGDAVNNGAGTVNKSRGVEGLVLTESSGNTTEAIAVYGGCAGQIAGATGVMTNCYEFFANTFGAGITNKWAFYSADATAQSVINGNLILNNSGSLLPQSATCCFPYVPGVAVGVPSGVPSTLTAGAFPMVWDHIDQKMYVYDGSWIAFGGGGGTITGSGTNNTITKWTGSSSIGNSSITDNGTTTTISEPAVFGGTVSLNGNVYTFPASQSASACLVTNGSGTLSWSSCASGSVGGTGTTNHLSKWSGASTIADSSITDNGTAITMGEPVAFSSTTTLNGIAYTWPGSQSASACLVTNGSGTLSWTSCASGSIGGTGSAGTMARFTASTTIANSGMTDDGATLITIPSERVVFGASSSDVAGSGGVIAVNSFWGVMSAATNANGLSIAYNSGANKLYIAGIVTGSATQVPIDIRVAATTIFRAENSGTDRGCVYVGGALHLFTLSGGTFIDGGICP